MYHRTHTLLCHWELPQLALWRDCVTSNSPRPQTGRAFLARFFDPPIIPLSCFYPALHTLLVCTIQTQWQKHHQLGGHCRQVKSWQAGNPHFYPFLTKTLTMILQSQPTHCGSVVEGTSSIISGSIPGAIPTEPQTEGHVQEQLSLPTEPEKV